jgi:hypothetical protein
MNILPNRADAVKRVRKRAEYGKILARFFTRKVTAE